MRWTATGLLILACGIPAMAVADSGVYTSPDEGGPRAWEIAPGAAALELRSEPADGAEELALVGAGTVLDNLGCAHVDGSVWCDVQPLGGGPRGFVPADRLKPARGPDGSVPTGYDDSALRAGERRFDATGKVPCARYSGQPTAACDFGVARSGGGDATVVITHPDGRTRIIFFRMGRPIGIDSSEADDPGPFSATKESDLNLIRAGAERYEIPDAVVLGG